MDGLHLVVGIVENPVWVDNRLNKHKNLAFARLFQGVNIDYQNIE